LYKFFVHVRHPSYRLVIKADAPFPSGASEHDWRFTRAREAGDINAEVRDAVIEFPLAARFFSKIPL
jgi:hypothetical protein